MSAASNYLETKLLDHSLGTASFTSPSTIYVGLFKSTVDAATTLANLEAGTLTDEVPTSGSTAYARQTITFNSASSPGGTATNNGAVTFTTATANWGDVTHLALLDGGTAGAGNVLYAGALDSTKTVETGDSFVIQDANLTITLA
jgi:hypothetical protein|tara:strand:- start:22 stop:456 length:435 start_codon:yes stop_codon:yes gene_type:complete